MASNEWTFTGVVRKFGESRPKDKSWGKIWISIEIPSIVNKVHQNSVIINVPTAYDNSLDGKRTERLKRGLKEGAFIFVHSAKVDLLKRAKKVGEEWEEYFETGIRVYPKGITIGTTRFDPVNIGLVAGKITETAEDQSTITIVETYIVPKTKEKKQRPIPILNEDGKYTDLVGKYVFAQLELAGRNPKGEYKTMGIATKLVVL